METRIKYQYTYFIQDFKIPEKMYDKFIEKLLNNKRLNLKIFNKDKNVELDTYFQQNLKNRMFESFSYSKEQIKELENKVSYDKICEMEAVCFEYKMESKLEAKIEQQNRNTF